MVKPKVLLAHLSDTHLGYRQYNMDEREQDFYEVFEEAVGEILREHVDVLIHTGDFFEAPRPPVKALYVAKEQLSKLRDRGVKVYAVLGDHDLPKRRGMPPHSLFTEYLTALGLTKDHDVVRSEGVEVFIGGVHHIPKRYKEGLKEKLRRLAKSAEGYGKSVLALHQSINKFLPFEYELSFDELPPSFSYIALGHLHRREKAWRGNTLVAYAGSLEITRRDEVEEWKKTGKGFFIVDLSGDQPYLHPVSLTRIRPQLEVKVDVSKLMEELNRVEEKVKALTKKPILHLYVEGLRIDRRRLFETVQSKLAPYLLTWRPEVVEKAEPEKIKAKEGLDWISLFKEAFNGDEELAYFAYELFKLLKTGSEGVEEARKLVEEFYLKGGWLDRKSGGA